MVSTGKEHAAPYHLPHDAAYRPYVYVLRVTHPQDNLCVFENNNFSFFFKRKVRRGHNDFVSCKKFIQRRNDRNSYRESTHLRGSVVAGHYVGGHHESSAGCAGQAEVKNFEGTVWLHYNVARFEVLQKQTKNEYTVCQNARCVRTQGASERTVRQNARCVRTQGASERTVRQNARCVRTHGASERTVCQNARCVRTHGVSERTVSKISPPQTETNQQLNFPRDGSPLRSFPPIGLWGLQPGLPQSSGGLIVVNNYLSQVYRSSKTAS